MFLGVKDLSVSYGKVNVLKGVSLAVSQGRIGVLLGANGSGKSTLLNAISGCIKSKSGTIWFQDTRIDNLSTSKILRAGIAHVPEGKGLFTEMTVKENLEMGAYTRKDRKGVAEDREALYLRFPVLRAKRNEISSRLSGGEQQTLAIARALMSRARVLLMDEPAQGLAPLVVNEMAETITEINHTGLTIVLVEHNLRLGLSLADHVYVLENGKIAFESESSDLSGVEYAKKIYLGG